MNCDHRVLPADAQAFVAALLNPSALDPCIRAVADVNHDNVVDGRDVDGFIDLLLPP